eukprot:scaffold13891_cov125-Isochrysis_galbana.AAC.5
MQLASGCICDSLFSSFMSIMCPCEDDAMANAGVAARLLRMTEGRVGSSRAYTSCGKACMGMRAVPIAFI